MRSLLATIVSLAAIALAVAQVDVTAPGAMARLLLWVAAVALTARSGLPPRPRLQPPARHSDQRDVVARAWLVLLVVLLPSTLNMIATTPIPSPSRVEMIQAMRVASDEADAEGSTLLARYYEDHPELASGDAQQAMNDFNLVRVAVGREVERLAHARCSTATPGSSPVNSGSSKAHDSCHLPS